MMRCLIVDDEPLARQLLESYLARIEELKHVKTCSNAVEAFTFLQEHPVDLIFLDIEMPQTNGIELLRSLKHKPLVILTTAYREYAFEAYDLDVVDYLLKPISFERFLRGIAKIKQLKQYEPQSPDVAEGQRYDDAYMYLKENREMVKVFLKDILYIESLRDYVRVKMLQREVITYQKISYLEQKLPQNKFVRVHRSFMIALDKVHSFTTNTINVGTHEIPIGRNYKNVTLRRLKQDHLQTPL
jgi:DNA-binding LytR/AlgR family response regulator